MKAIKDYLLGLLKKKSIYFLFVIVVLDIVALILYYNFGTSVFIPDLSSDVITLLIVGMVLGIAIAFVPFKLAYVALYAIQLFACFEYLASQATFIANVFTAIDGTTFPAAFYVIIICTLGGAVLSLVGMALLKEPQRKNKNAAADGAAITEAVK